jgi:hypothetical protein
MKLKQAIPLGNPIRASLFSFAGIGVAGFLVFILPWHIPIQGPVDSQSYVFGFHNTAALVGLAGILVFLAWQRASSAEKRGQDQRLFVELWKKTPRSPADGLYVATGCALFSSLTLLGWWMFLPYGFFGETAYFLTRLDMMNLGFRPFRDFEFGYGPAMLWIPWALSRVTGGFLAIDTAYILTVGLFFFLGIFALRLITMRLNLPGLWLSVVILFGSLSFFNPTLGIQYTPIRFLYPMMAAFLCHEKVRRGLAWGFAASFFLPLGGFMLGPEVGLVTTLGILAGLLAYWPSDRRKTMVCLLAPLGALGVIRLVFGPQYFDIIRSFGGGAYNFPIVPAPYLLSLLGLSLWILPRIFAASFGRGEGSPLGLSLVVCAGLALPAALGRCDPGHVLFNGAGVFLLAIAACLRGKPKKGLPWVGVAYLICLTTMEISFWNHYDLNIQNVVRVRKIISENLPIVRLQDFEVQKELEKQHPRQKTRWDKRLPYSTDLLVPLQYPSIAQMRGGGEDLDRFLKGSGRYVPDYYVPPFDSLFSPTSAQKKSESLGKAEFVLVPEARFAQFGEIDSDAYARGWSEFLSGLFYFPVACRAVNAPFDPDQVILKNLSCSHHPVGRFRDMLVLQANRPKKQK